MGKNFRFGLFDSHDQLIDETNIDEDDFDFAMDLFKSYQASEGYSITPSSGHYVLMLDDEDEGEEEWSDDDSKTESVAHA